MAKIEVEKKTGLEEAVALSRQLPQLGLHPEISLQNTHSIVVEKSQEQQIATVWEKARLKAITQKPNNYRWGVFSALKDYLDGNL